MRHDTPYAGRDDGDIVAEANRIIRQSTVHGRVAAVDSACKKSALFSRAVSFGIGMLTGGGICALIAIIF
jgi:hypothetical protein